MSLRAIIVDDEQLARQRLARMLRAYPDIEIVGEAADGQEGMELVRRAGPDVIFLDIKMPKLSGFGMLRQLETCPQIVFTTAYDEHALRAFEENTIDYLLKPIAIAHLDRAIGKLRRFAQEGTRLAADLEQLRASLEHSSRYLRRFSVGSGRKIILLQDQDVDYFHAEEKYTFLHAAGKSHIVPFAIKELDERLDPDRFARVHRAYIVNLDRIESARREVGGRLRLFLESGEEIPVSRRHAEEFRKRIGL
jgi:two-component system LytT family response regulator